jgi:adenylate kinase
MLRASIADGSEIGRRVQEIVDRGDLAPDDLMIEIIRDRLRRSDTGRGFLLDGFPRTRPQAEALDVLLVELGRALSVVLEFRVPEDVVVDRLLGRGDGRSDDTIDVIRHRMRVYREQTEPLVAYYEAKGTLVGVHADQAIDDVASEVGLALDRAAGGSGA